MRNSPVAIYLGCMALAAAAVAWATSPAAPPTTTPVATVVAEPAETAVAETAWPPAQPAVAYHAEMVQLLTTESRSAQKAWEESYAKASPPQQREVVREPPTKKRQATRRRPRTDERIRPDNGSTEVVIRDGSGYRSARVPRERTLRDDAPPAYAPPPQERGPFFFGNW